jgi:hypothetical protein
LRQGLARPRIITATLVLLQPGGCRMRQDRSEYMSHYYALLSVIFMIGFVGLFDCMHVDKWNTRFCKDRLLSREEIDQLRKVLLACQES